METDTTIHDTLRWALERIEHARNAHAKTGKICWGTIDNAPVEYHQTSTYLFFAEMWIDTALSMLPEEGD